MSVISFVLLFVQHVGIRLRSITGIVFGRLYYTYGLYIYVKPYGRSYGIGPLSSRIFLGWFYRSD